MAKSYFAILGITTRASQDEIRSAYRRLAKEYHPDYYEGDSGPFRQIQEAYSVLGNAQRRAEYEGSLDRPVVRRTAKPTPYPEPEPLIPKQRPADMGDISPIRSFETFSPSFDEVFDWLWDNFSSLGRPKSGRVQRLALEVPLSRKRGKL
jgi:curved DNA-binding protein CbpA